MQYTEIFKVVKNENFHQKKFDIFLIFAQNIDCGYTLEPPRRGGSNEYPQSMFWSKNKKNRYTPAYPSFTIQKWGSRGYTYHGHVFVMKKKSCFKRYKWATIRKRRNQNETPTPNTEVGKKPN